MLLNWVWILTVWIWRRVRLFCFRVRVWSWVRYASFKEDQHRCESTGYKKSHDRFKIGSRFLNACHASPSKFCRSTPPATQKLPQVFFFLSISLPSMCTAAPPLKIFLRGGAAVHRLLFVLWNNPLLWVLLFLGSCRTVSKSTHELPLSDCQWLPAMTNYHNG